MHLPEIAQSFIIINKSLENLFMYCWSFPMFSVYLLGIASIIHVNGIIEKKKGDLEKPKRAPQVYKEIFITLSHYILAINETIWNFQLYILHREVILVRILQLGEHDECIFDDNLNYVFLRWIT